MKDGNGNGHDGDLFAWGNQYVRPTDPECSHEAAARLDEKRASYEALCFFKWFYCPDGLTAAEFEQHVEDHLMRLGWDSQAAYRKAESWRRRLTELCKKYRRITVRRDAAGKLLKRSRRQIYFLNS